jgi:hypothetical protein
MPETRSIENSKLDALEVIRGLSHGDVAFDLSEKLSTLVAKVSELKSKGKLTFTLDVCPEPKLGNGASRIVADCIIKLPKAEPKADIRLVTDDGQMLKDDPAQIKFPFMADLEKKSKGKE